MNYIIRATKQKQGFNFDTVSFWHTAHTRDSHACVVRISSLTVIAVVVMMRDGTGSVRFYCTAGAGMEAFLLDEVKRRLKATEVKHLIFNTEFKCLLLQRERS